MNLQLTGRLQFAMLTMFSACGPDATVALPPQGHTRTESAHIASSSPRSGLRADELPPTDWSAVTSIPGNCRAFLSELESCINAMPDHGKNAAEAAALQIFGTWMDLPAEKRESVCIKTRDAFVKDSAPHVCPAMPWRTISVGRTNDDGISVKLRTDQ